MREMTTTELEAAAGGDVTGGDLGSTAGAIIGGLLFGGVVGGAVGALAGKVVGEFFACESTVNACNTDLNMGHVNLTM